MPKIYQQSHEVVFLAHFSILSTHNMAPPEGMAVGMIGSEVLPPSSSVLDLLQEHFPRLQSAADELLFEPDAVRKSDVFGFFQFVTIVNNECTIAVKRSNGRSDDHTVSVVWTAASFLFCQKIFRVGAPIDAELDESCPIILDQALLYKHCGGGKNPTRACTRSLCAEHLRLVIESNMKLLVPAKLYSAYSGLICSLAKEIRTTGLTAVAVQAMLGIANVASTAFIKVAASQNEVDPKTPNPPGIQFPKEDVSHDLMQSLTKPLYGHHPLLIVTVAAIGHETHPESGEIDWPATMKTYEGSLIWLFDWDVAGRDDNLPAHFAAMVASDNISGVEPAADTVLKAINREKNRIGCLVTRWDTATENVLILGTDRKLARHSGWLCKQPDIIREIVATTASYFQFGFWPAGDWTNVRDLWWDLAAYTGAMTRGWMLDHDTEADIGEHNGMNWVCKYCTPRILERATALEMSKPLRTVRHQRLAWGPQPYFFYSRRHSGLARRVYSSKFFSRPEIPWGVVDATIFDRAVTVPIPANSLDATILHLLNLAGYTADDTGVKRIAAAMPAIDSPCSLGACAVCEYEGMGLDMMMYGRGVMVIAALLKEPVRRRFIWEIDAYGGRAFPKLFSRMLTGCTCTSYWIESSTQLGYGWGFSDCGSDSCCTEARPTPPAPSPIEDSDRAWSKNARVQTNMQRLMEACKREFESMDSVRGQIEAGTLDERWSMLNCIEGLHAMLGIERKDA